MRKGINLQQEQPRTTHVPTGARDSGSLQRGRESLNKTSVAQLAQDGLARGSKIRSRNFNVLFDSSCTLRMVGVYHQ